MKPKTMHKTISNKTRDFYRYFQAYRQAGYSIHASRYSSAWIINGGWVCGFFPSISNL